MSDKYDREDKTSDGSGTPRARLGRGKARQATDAFANLIAEATRRGFYGAVTLDLKVQDGAIEQVRVTTERVVR